VNWNNQPTTTGLVATASTPFSAGMMRWSVTEQVKGMYSSGNYGFLIRDATEGSSVSVVQQFHSNQTTPNVKRPPELVIPFNLRGGRSPFRNGLGAGSLRDPRSYHETLLRRSTCRDHPGRRERGGRTWLQTRTTESCIAPLAHTPVTPDEQPKGV
jgi:hypothetical protein